MSDLPLFESAKCGVDAGLRPANAINADTNILAHTSMKQFFFQGLEHVSRQGHKSMTIFKLERKVGYAQQTPLARAPSSASPSNPIVGAQEEQCPIFRPQPNGGYSQVIRIHAEMVAEQAD
jgi:hypothetical protein